MSSEEKKFTADQEYILVGFLMVIFSLIFRWATYDGVAFRGFMQGGEAIIILLAYPTYKTYRQRKMNGKIAYYGVVFALLLLGGYFGDFFFFSDSEVYTRLGFGFYLCLGGTFLAFKGIRPIWLEYKKEEAIKERLYKTGPTIGRPYVPEDNDSDEYNDGLDDVLIYHYLSYEESDEYREYQKAINNSPYDHDD